MSTPYNIQLSEDETEEARAYSRHRGGHVMAKQYEGILIGRGLKFAIVVSRFNELITTQAA
jgi:hypothetical protein